MIWWLYPIVGAFLLSVFATLVVRRLAIRWNIVDAPVKERKHHIGSVPLLGGVGILVGFAIPTLSILFATDHLTSGDISMAQIVGFIGGGLILVVGGALDDKYDLKPRQAIVFPILAALVAIGSGFGVAKITNPAGGAFVISGIVSDAIVFVWLMTMMYTTKLLDGLDGLTTGVGTVAGLMIALLALSSAFYQPDVALLALIAVASLVGFFLWNAPPALIFLGEGGSTYIGYLVGGLAIISGSKMATALLVLGVPAFDIVLVLLDRLRRRQPLFVGDRAHFHHRLKALGLSDRSVLAIYLGVSTIFGLTTLVFESWQKLIALAVLFVMLVGAVVVIEGRKVEK